MKKCKWLSLILVLMMGVLLCAPAFADEEEQTELPSRGIGFVLGTQNARDPEHGAAFQELIGGFADGGDGGLDEDQEVRAPQHPVMDGRGLQVADVAVQPRHIDDGGAAVHEFSPGYADDRNQRFDVHDAGKFVFNVGFVQDAGFLIDIGGDVLPFLHAPHIVDYQLEDLIAVLTEDLRDPDEEEESEEKAEEKVEEKAEEKTEEEQTQREE